MKNSANLFLLSTDTNIKYNLNVFLKSFKQFNFIALLIMLVNRFQSYIKHELAVEDGSKIIATVSGGIDSMVMLKLLSMSAYQLVAAHCNFQLRGDESDQDEAFVKGYCQDNQIPFYVQRFDTNDYAEKKRFSVQMAARDLRYQWFEGLRQELGYQYIAVAHNLDDQVETFFINLARGTGLKGMLGIKGKSKNIVRPVLFATRENIMNFAIENQIPFREDSSNATVKYKRNRIRHHIIPEFKELNPSFLETMKENMERFREIEQLTTEHLDEEKNRLIQKTREEIIIDIEKLKTCTAPGSVMFELLKEAGFPGGAIQDIMESINAQPGKLFYSKSHELLRDRTSFILKEKKKGNNEEFLISENTDKLEYPIKLRFEKIQRAAAYKVSGDEHIAELDANKLVFPLVLRRWQEGDYFYPLGLKGKKKLSDYFVDQKFNLFEKNNCWLLVSGGDIVWIIPYRMDDRYKITSDTDRIYKIKKE